MLCELFRLDVLSALDVNVMIIQTDRLDYSLVCRREGLLLLECAFLSVRVVSPRAVVM